MASQDENSLFSECVLDLSKYLTSSDMSSSPQAYFNEIFDADKNKPVQAPSFVKVKEEPLDESQPTSRCSTPESLLPDHDFDKSDFPSPMFQPLTNGTSNPRPSTFQGSSSFHGSVGGGSTSAIHAALQNANQGGVGGLKLPLFSQLQSIHRYNNNNNNINGAGSSLPLGTSTASSIASSIQSSANTSDVDNSDEEMTPHQLSVNAKRLQHALAKLEEQDDPKPEPMDMEGFYPGFAHANKFKAQQRTKARKYIEKGTEEYVLKRERNNVAVRKSRTKAKLKHIETQMRVGELSEENNQLRNRITSLQKEVNALKQYISYHIPNSGNHINNGNNHINNSAPNSATNSPTKPQQQQQQQQLPAPVSPVYSSYGSSNVFPGSSKML